mmetsp:Transcript_100676/g.314708  ORF Transcript_100676/g.314708 Transcript_100676/m.314708 type:complete len:572 (+) Transcript_100676:511-2226(+)
MTERRPLNCSFVKWRPSSDRWPVALISSWKRWSWPKGGPRCIVLGAGGICSSARYGGGATRLVMLREEDAEGSAKACRNSLKPQPGAAAVSNSGAATPGKGRASVGSVGTVQTATGLLAAATGTSSGATAGNSPGPFTGMGTTADRPAGGSIGPIAIGTGMAIGSTGPRSIGGARELTPMASGTVMAMGTGIGVAMAIPPRPGPVMAMPPRPGPAMATGPSPGVVMAMGTTVVRPAEVGEAVMAMGAGMLMAMGTSGPHTISMGAAMADGTATAPGKAPGRARWPGMATDPSTAGIAGIGPVMAGGTPTGKGSPVLRPEVRGVGTASGSCTACGAGRPSAAATGTSTGARKAGRAAVGLWERPLSSEAVVLVELQVPGATRGSSSCWPGRLRPPRLARGARHPGGGSSFNAVAMAARTSCGAAQRTPVCGWAASNESGSQLPGASCAGAARGDGGGVGVSHRSGWSSAGSSSSGCSRSSTSSSGFGARTGCGRNGKQPPVGSEVVRRSTSSLSRPHSSPVVLRKVLRTTSCTSWPRTAMSETRQCWVTAGGRSCTFNTQSTSRNSLGSHAP